ncbi:hypothetical protein AAC387_Pa04g0481 [Persea americana]
MSIFPSSEERGYLRFLLLGSRRTPTPHHHGRDEDEGGLAYVGYPPALTPMHRLQRGDEDQGGLAYLQLGFPTAPAPTPCLPSGDLEQGGAAPPVEEGSLPAVASRMRTGDLEQGGTPYLASDQACDDNTPWWCALGAMGLVTVGLVLLNWSHLIG